jgi:hypothetical protein
MVCVGLPLCFMLLTSSPDDRKIRGDYPRCQQECLQELQQGMSRLSEAYVKNGDRLRYEEQVEEVNGVYDRCLRDCKELIPVK